MSDGSIYIEYSGPDTHYLKTRKYTRLNVCKKYLNKILRKSRTISSDGETPRYQIEKMLQSTYYGY